MVRLPINDNKEEILSNTSFFFVLCPLDKNSVRGESYEKIPASRCNEIRRSHPGYFGALRPASQQSGNSFCLKKSALPAGSAVFLYQHSLCSEGKDVGTRLFCQLLPQTFSQLLLVVVYLSAFGYLLCVESTGFAGMDVSGRFFCRLFCHRRILSFVVYSGAGYRFWSSSLFAEKAGLCAVVFHCGHILLVWGD